MLREKLKKSLPVGSFVVGFMLIACFGLGLKRISFAESETSQLTLELSTQKSSYVQLEPVRFGLKLSNPSTQAVKLQGILSTGRDLDFFIQPVGGESKNIEGRKMSIATVISSPILLQPGQEVESAAGIDEVSLFEKAFPGPGAYQVRVKFRYEKIEGDKSSTESVISNPVTVNIEAPKGDDYEAYNYIKNTLEVARDRRVSSEEILVLRQNFVDTFGSSVYAEKEILELAVTYKHLGQDLKAMRELCKLSDENENTRYFKYVQKSLREIDIKLHPPDMSPLPENATLPVRPHPCSQVHR
ncbi:MAG: hypothetical protein ACRD6X_14620 [Pyrinomonadaceae bacterium]